MGRFIGCVLFSTVLLSCGSPLWAQTDVAVSAFGAFNESNNWSTTTAPTGLPISQSPSNQAGTLIEVRHIRNPLVGYEVTYAYNRANQAYTNKSQVCSGFGCSGPIAAIVSANAHEFTADWIVSLKVLNLRPFALVGGGVLINTPTNGTLLSTSTTCQVTGACVTSTNATPTPTQTEAKASFIYGAGVDWTVLPHLGLRFQYRGRVYKAPDLATVYSSPGNSTRTSEPVIGVFLRF